MTGERKVHLTPVSRIVLILCAALIVAGTVLLFYETDDGARSRIAFSMFETLVMILLIWLPIFLNKIIRVRIPASMEIIFVSFCFSTLILGDVADFYGRFHWWDDLQHGMSGILLGVLGYMIINTFNRFEQNGRFRYSPAFLSIWVLCFALACGALWEIAEYCIDGWFGLNSQQFLASPGTFDKSVPLQGHAALADTMQDLMLDFAGGLLMAVLGYFDMRRLRRRFTDMSLEMEGDGYEYEIQAMSAATIDRFGSEEWERALQTNEIHGHTGIYSIIGVKMGIRAKELLADKGCGAPLSIVSYTGDTPPLSSLCDGLQVSTGATLGNGRIHLSPEAEKRAEADFYSGDKILKIRLKEDFSARIKVDIAEGVKQFGHSPAYREYIRRLSLRYWTECDRREIFDENLTLKNQKC